MLKPSSCPVIDGFCLCYLLGWPHNKKCTHQTQSSEIFFFGKIHYLILLGLPIVGQD